MSSDRSPGLEVHPCPPSVRDLDDRQVPVRDRHDRWPGHRHVADAGSTGRTLDATFFESVDREGGEDDALASGLGEYVLEPFDKEFLDSISRCDDRAAVWRRDRSDFGHLVEHRPGGVLEELVQGRTVGDDAALARNRFVAQGQPLRRVSSITVG